MHIWILIWMKYQTYWIFVLTLHPKVVLALTVVRLNKLILMVMESMILKTYVRILEMDF